MSNFRIFYNSKINYDYKNIKKKTQELLKALGTSCKECDTRSCPFMYEENKCIKINLLAYLSMINEVENTKYTINK